MRYYKDFLKLVEIPVKIILRNIWVYKFVNFIIPWPKLSRKIIKKPVSTKKLLSDYIFYILTPVFMVFPKLYFYLLFKQKLSLKSDEDVLLIAANSGECYLALQWIEHIKRENNVKKLLVVGNRKYHQDVFDLFVKDKENNRFAYCSLLLINNDLLTEKAIINNHTTYIQSPRKVSSGHRVFIPFGIGHDKATYKYFSKNCFNYLDYVRREMNHCNVKLSKNYKLERPIISKDGVRDAEKKFLELGLNTNKIVMVSPEANSFVCPYGKDIWQRIVNLFHEKGYDVFLNSMSKGHGLVNIKTGFLSFSEAFILADRCDHIVTLRSGFSEIISLSYAMIHVIADPGLIEYMGLRHYVNDNNCIEYDSFKLDEEQFMELLAKNVCG